MTCGLDGRFPPGRAVLVMLALATVTRPVPSMAGECLEYSSYSHWVGHLPGYVGRIAAAGAVVYACPYDDDELYIFDISDLESPRRISRLQLCASPRAVAALGPIAFVGDFQDLVIVDAQDPMSPVVLSRLTLPGGILAISSWNRGILCVAMHRAGLAIVDASDFRNPRLLGRANTPGWAVDVAMLGSIAYVADYDFGVEIIDVSDPGVPDFLGYLNDPPGVLTERCVIHAGLLYVVRRSGLDVYDLADPARPRHVGQVPSTGIGPILSVLPRYDRVFLGTDGGVAEVAVPITHEPPNLRAFVPLPGLQGDLEPLGDWVFAAGHDGGFHVVDSTSRVQPGPLGAVDAAWAFSIEVSGRHAYTAGRRGLGVVDISDPRHPVHVARVSFPTQGLADVVVAGNRAIAVDGRESLYVVDVSDPKHPARLGAVRTPGVPKSVVVAGDRAYVALGTRGFVVPERGLAIFDVATPTAPSLVSYLWMPEYGYAIDVAGTLVSLVSDDALHVIDVSDAWNPRLLGTVSYPETAPYQDRRTIRVDRGYAYVATGASGLSIVDVSQPESPRLVTTVPLADQARDVAVANGIAWVAAATGGLQVLDIRQPENPRRIGAVTASVLTTQEAVAISDGWVYAVGLDSLRIFAPQRELPTPVVVEDLMAARTAGGVRLSGRLRHVVDRFQVLRTTSESQAQPRTVFEASSMGPGAWEVLDDDVRVDVEYAYQVVLSVDGEVASSPWVQVAPESRAAARLSLQVLQAVGQAARLRFDLQRPAAVRLDVFDLRGRRVRRLVEGAYGAGEHVAAWDGRDDRGIVTASGLYFARLEAGGREARARFVALH